MENAKRIKHIKIVYKWECKCKILGPRALTAKPNFNSSLKNRENIQGIQINRK